MGSVLDDMFRDFLNIPDCNSLPDVKKYRLILEEHFRIHYSKTINMVVEQYNLLIAKCGMSMKK